MQFSLIWPLIWLEWGLGLKREQAPGPPEADMPTHDAGATDSRKIQQTLGKLVNQGRHAAHRASLDQLPETARPLGTGRPARRESKPGRSPRLDTRGDREHEPPHAFGRGQRTLSVSCLHHSSFVGIGRRFMGIEEHVAQ